MTISRRDQVLARRLEVARLDSMGLTQQEISERLVVKVSRRTVGNDIEWLNQQAVEEFKNHRMELVAEHRRVLTNLKELRKRAWEHLEKTQDESIKVHLYSFLGSVNNNIHALVAAGDMIAEELLIESQETIVESKQQLQDIMNKSKSHEYHHKFSGN